MSLSNRDRMLLQRFFDGELAGDEKEALRRRLEAEPDLRAELAALREASRGFEAGRDRTFTAPAGFAAGVLGAVRQLPSRIELQEAEATADAMRLCRRLLVAAALLFGLGLCWHAGLFDGSRADTLEASPGEIERAMSELDARIAAWGDGDGVVSERGR